MKRLLPLGVLLLAGAAEAALLPVKPRCAGMAELKKKLATASLDIPATGLAGDFDGKQHCDQTVWNYLAFHAKERVAFNTLDGKQQLDIIEKYAKQLEDVERRLTPIKGRVDAFRADVAAFRDAKTKAGKKLELLDKIIAKEGEPDSLDPAKISAATVIGGTHMQNIRAGFNHLAQAEMLARHGAEAPANKAFGASQLRILWTPNPSAGPNQPKGLGAFHFADWALGQQTFELYRDAMLILNDVNAEIRGADGKGRLAELKAALLHQDVKDMLADKEKRQPEPKPKPPTSDKEPAGDAKKKPQDVKGAEQTVGDATEAFRKSFADKTSAMIFDGLDQRTKLDPSDPNHLTVDQAKKIREEFKGDAEIVDKKVVYTVTDSKGKKMKIGTEVELPADLAKDNAKTKGEDLAKNVADTILKGEHLKATVDAVIGAVTGAHAPADPAKPTLTVDAGGQKIEVPRDFGADVAAANCGSPLDIGKTKEQLAAQAAAAEIAKHAANYSKGRAEVMKEEKKAQDAARAAYEKQLAAIDAEAAKERQNPFFTDFEGQAKRVAEQKAAASKALGDAIAEAEKARTAALSKGGRVGDVKDVDARMAKDEADKKQGISKYYSEGVARHVDESWAAYKAELEARENKQNAKTPKLDAIAKRLFGETDAPKYKRYITPAMVDSYFTKTWKEKREDNLKAMRKDIGAPDDETLAKTKLEDIRGLPKVEKVQDKVDEQLTTHLKAMLDEAKKRREAAEKAATAKK